MKKKVKLPAVANAEKYWPYILWGSFLLLSVVSLWGLWGVLPRFNHDNVIEFWLAAFDNLIKSGQWSPNWVKDFYFGYGSPLFVFYPPLFFYLAEIPRLLGTTLVVAVKLAAAVSFMAAFWGMYALVRELWGKWAGLIAGLIYLTAPYHFALIFIRGAYAENLAYAFLPLVLFLIYRIFNRANYLDVVGLSVVVALVILTNIPSVIIAVILSFLFTIGLVIIYRKFPWRSLLVAIIGGLGLSASFWLPVVTNYKLIQSNVFFEGGLAFYHHFVGLSQYWRIDLWNNDNYFHIGLLGIIIILLAVGYAISRPKLIFTPSRHNKNDRRWLFIGLGILALLVILTLPISIWIWKNLPGIIYLQFPFRLLGAISLVLAVLAGWVIGNTNWASAGRTVFVVFFILIQTAILAYPVMQLLPDIYKYDFVYTPVGDIATQLNYRPAYNQTESVGWQSINRHTAEWGYGLQGVDVDKIISEIWPIETGFSNQSFEQSLLYRLPLNELVKTSAQISNFEESANGVVFDYAATTSEEVVYHQIGFPGWQVKVDDQIISWVRGDNQKIQFIVPAGQHRVNINYTYPPGALLGRWLSLCFLLGLIGWIFYLRTHKKSLIKNDAVSEIKTDRVTKQKRK